MRSDECNFRAFYGIRDSGLQGSWSILYFLLEYVNCLNKETTQMCFRDTQLWLLMDTGCTEPKGIPDCRQMQLNRNGTVIRSLHEKGNPYATQISSTKCFLFIVIRLKVWVPKKTTNQKNPKNPNKKTNKKAPKLSSYWFLESTSDGTFT